MWRVLASVLSGSSEWHQYWFFRHIEERQTREIHVRASIVQRWFLKITISDILQSMHSPTCVCARAYIFRRGNKKNPIIKSALDGSRPGCRDPRDWCIILRRAIHSLTGRRGFTMPRNTLSRDGRSFIYQFQWYKPRSGITNCIWKYIKSLTGFSVKIFLAI